MELKVREFCAFDCIKELFFKGLFQSNYLKKTCFAENTVKVHMFESPVLADSLTDRLSIYLSKCVALRFRS